MAESAGSGGHAPHELGRRGERLAECYLRGRGWSILARNYRFGRREIDLVVRRGDLVVFVEVKTRGGTGYGGPAAAINWRKRREIEGVAADYLFRNRLGDVSVRFDVVAIEAVMSQGGRRLEHIEDAWRIDWG